MPSNMEMFEAEQQIAMLEAENERLRTVVEAAREGCDACHKYNGTDYCCDCYHAGSGTYAALAALEAEVERLNATLAAKEESQRANEDEMDAEIARLRAVADAAREIAAAHEPPGHLGVWVYGECDCPICAALAALDEEVGE